MNQNLFGPSQMLRAPVSLFVTLALGACAATPSFIPAPLDYRQPSTTGVATAPTSDEQQSPAKLGEVPRIPSAGKLTTEKGIASSKAGPAEKADISLTFDQIPLPTFIQVVYGSILKKNFSVDPQLSTRQDLVTLRTGTPQTPTEVQDTTQLLLKSYGVAVINAGGFYRIVPDNAASGYASEIRRGRALPDTPLPLRPIFYYVTLQAIKAPELEPMLKQVLGNRVTTIVDPGRNAIMLSGQSNDVTAALEAIQVLDQPVMQGRASGRFNPVFWSAEELARRLTEILNAEGYSVGSTTNMAQSAVIMLPVSAINSVIVFADNPTVVNHIAQWVQELDKPTPNRGGGYFTYPVRYADAEALAKTMQTLLSGAASTTAASTTAAAAGQAQVARSTGSSRVVVHSATNSLIFQGSAEDYTRWVGLLQELDRPAKTALIEVTVAEVTLTDENKLGIEWALSQAAGGGAR